MSLPFPSRYVFALLASAFTLAACGPTSEETRRAREAERQETVGKFGSPYGAKSWKLTQMFSEPRFTASLQEEIEGSIVAFRAHIIDVVRRSEDDYELIIGDRFLSKDIVSLRSVRAGVAEILTNPPGTFDSFLFVAEIRKVQPLLLELNACNEPDCRGTVSLEPRVTGVRHRMIGQLIAIERDGSRDAYQ